MTTENKPRNEIEISFTRLSFASTKKAQSPASTSSEMDVPGQNTRCLSFYEYMQRYRMLTQSHFGDLETHVNLAQIATESDE